MNSRHIRNLAWRKRFQLPYEDNGDFSSRDVFDIAEAMIEYQHRQETVGVEKTAEQILAEFQQEGGGDHDGHSFDHPNGGEPRSPGRSGMDSVVGTGE